MKKILIILSIVILAIIMGKETNKVLIPSESIRIRVIGNSNNIYDQELKLKVKKELENTLYKKLDNVTSINDARTIISSNMEELDSIVKNTINSNNYSINYGYNYFPKKTYKGITYEDGNYESLVVKLGEGNGNNWWCILFPPLCMLDAKYSNSDNIEYKSKVLEIINAYK